MNALDARQAVSHDEALGGRKKVSARQVSHARSALLTLRLGAILLPLLGLSSAPASSQAPGERSASTPLPVLEELIVMAQKRSEPSQIVPLAVTVMDSVTLDARNVLGLVRLSDVDPNVFFETAQSFQRSSLQIRGIGTLGNTRSFEGAVGVFVDNVYRPRAGMVLSELLDVESVEILRGPQTTLYGKNTSAGAISVRSRRPVIGAFSAEGELQIGNLAMRHLAGAANVPLGAASAMRIAGTYLKRDGFFQSPDSSAEYDTVDRYGLKWQLLLMPSSPVEVLLVADYGRSDAHCCWSAALADAGPTAPLIDMYARLNGLTFSQPPSAERERSESLNTLPEEEIEDKGLSARVRWDLGSLGFQSLTSVREWSHAQIRADADFSPADLFRLDEPARIAHVAQELNLTLPLGPADLLLGAYYEQEDYDSRRSAQTGADADNYLNALLSANLGAAACLPPVVAVDCVFPVGAAALLPNGEFTRERYWQDARNAALFAHSTIRLSDRFGVVAGMRHSLDRKEGGVDNEFWYDAVVARSALAGAGIEDDGTPRNGLDLIGTLYGPSFRAEHRNETTAGMLSVQYFPSDDVMLFAGYHRGYKAGGVNLFREGAITDTTYEPEYARSVEVGVKAEYLSGRARTNVVLFDTRFSDLQINFFTGLEFETKNTGSATTRGVEIESDFRISDALRLSLTATHLDTAFGAINDPFLEYLEGRDTPKSPRWAAVAGVSYTRPLTGRLSMVVRGLASYSGSRFVGAEVPSEQRVGSYVLTDLQLGVQSSDGRWEGSVWCTNCGDRSYRTVYFNSTFQPGSYSVYLNAPRQFGIRIAAGL